MGGVTITRLSHVKEVVGLLFDISVSVAVRDPRHPQPAVWPDEAALIAQARPPRRAEFAAGRSAVRDALSAMGLPPCALLAGPDRAPIWPVGLVGSISHTDRLCLAAVTRSARSIGIDLEPATPLDRNLWSEVCSDRELQRIDGATKDTGLLAKLIFCAKEAAYKAQYPLTRQLFGFDHFDVTLDLAQGRFTAEFVKSADAFAIGDALQGRFAQVADHLVTAVAIGHSAQEETGACA